MQQQSTWERLAPLTGLVFVAIAVAVFAIGGSTPGDHDTAQQVQAFYGQHHDKHTALAFLLALSLPFLLFFVSSLRYELRRAGGTGQLANAAFAGGVLAAEASITLDRGIGEVTLPGHFQTEPSIYSILLMTTLPLEFSFGNGSSVHWGSPILNRGGPG